MGLGVIGKGVVKEGRDEGMKFQKSNTGLRERQIRMKHPRCGSEKR